MMLLRLLGNLVGLLFPSLCAACGVHLYRGERHICTKCRHDLPYTDHYSHTDNAAAKKFWGRLELDAVSALLHFKKGNRVQNILHSLKYRNRPQLGEELGRMMGEKLLQTPGYTSLAMIIPVPLHKHRQKERGYNQSLMLAKGVSEQLEVSVQLNILERLSATESQTRKGRFDRHENMKGVFGLKNSHAVAGRHILLVDDVITTGATLEACAALLMEHGAGKVSIAAVAFAD